MSDGKCTSTITPLALLTSYNNSPLCFPLSHLARNSWVVSIYHVNVVSYMRTFKHCSLIVLGEN